MKIVDVGKHPFYKVIGAKGAAYGYMKYSAKQTYRYYEDNCWFVHESYLENLVKIHGPGVDVDGLPAYLRDKLIEEVTLDDESAHATLFVTRDAPKEVIKAAFKALALIHHPDRGGDEKVFSKITRAYELLGYR